MPAQQPTTSQQNFRTPANFLRAAEHKLGIETFSIDVSADEENAVVDIYYNEARNGLICPWNPIHPTWGIPIGGIAWCNMEFGQIAAWVEKAYAEAHLDPTAEGAPAPATSALLVPAGVGANWWRDWVHGKARVLLLNGRLCFIHDWQHTIDPASLKLKDGKPQEPYFYKSAPLYPKDCCLLIYGPGVIPTYECWTWPMEVVPTAEPLGTDAPGEL
jgi:hypothetical protein